MALLIREEESENLSMNEKEQHLRMKVFFKEYRSTIRFNQP